MVVTGFFAQCDMMICSAHIDTVLLLFCVEVEKRVGKGVGE